jgi:hypothetical protein
MGPSTRWQAREMDALQVLVKHQAMVLGPGSGLILTPEASRNLWSDPSLGLGGHVRAAYAGNTPDPVQLNLIVGP